MAIRYIITVANATDRANQIRNLGLNVAGIAFQRDNNTLAVLDPDSGTVYNIPVTGTVKAEGTRTQVAATDTVVTGLSLVSSVQVTPATRTIKQLFFNADKGDQAGSPAAGSILLKSQKPTGTGDVTPIAATDFTDAISVNWVAFGTL